ncbi:MAG TPA: outer membrane lipoprotein-sorting protein [Caulobacteraceae bacterium]|nr:outer membrane lipoprotein-sorting protein [Caulobacteraceae bacterium]
MGARLSAMIAAGFVAAGLAAAVAAPGLARAAPDADTILRKAYDNYRSQSSQSAVAMTIHRPAWERHLDLKAWTRGEDDALVRFTAPSKDAGSATLKLGRDTWVYNPRLNQVIKLPASMMSQSWMGSDFSYDDLAKSTGIITDYTHRLVGSSQSGGHAVWTIEATPKPGAPVVWGKVSLAVRDDYVILEETFFDQDMKPARRMNTGKVGLVGGRPYPVSMTMSPLDQPGQWTRTDTADARFNAALPPWLFTLSNLQNPR